MTAWKDSLERRDEVKAAFEEGFRKGSAGRDGPAEDSFLADEWRDSDARARLEKPLDK